MYCSKCGTEVSDGYAFCSNCGAELAEKNNASEINNSVAPQQQNQAVQPTLPLQYQENYNNTQPQTQNAKFNGMSIAGFILSLCAFLTDEAGIICAILGLVFSIIGLASKNQFKSKGKGFAIAGLVISGIYFLMILCALMFIGSVFSGLFWASRY